jgi:hypothetical protein
MIVNLVIIEIAWESLAHGLANLVSSTVKYLKFTWLNTGSGRYRQGIDSRFPPTSRHNGIDTYKVDRDDQGRVDL